MNVFVKMRKGFLVAACLILDTPAFGVDADELIDIGTLPIVKHEAADGVPFPRLRGGEDSSDTKIYVPNISGEEDEDTDKESEPYKLAEIPNCLEPFVKRESSGYVSPVSPTLDLLFYRGDDDEQYQAASEYKGVSRLVAYGIEGGESSLFSGMAEVLKIRCLPTRHHITEVEGKPMIEYREGEAAWE